MGKLAAFGIKFSSDNTVFFPGNVVSGELFMQLNETMEMRAVRIKFVGRAHVHWTEQHSTGSGKNRRTTTRHYSATQNLFEQTVVVFGEGSSENRNSIPQGHHVFPFNFQLPALLPSSYEDHIGHIRYHVKGTIDKPWKFDRNTKRAFTVLDALDLNSIPAVMSPAGGSDNKALCCMCCKSGPIEVDFHSDRSGYVPGEFILINATLTNSSNSKVRATAVHLVQQVTYHATTKSRTIPRTLATINGLGCNAHQSMTWRNEKLRIPPLPPSESTHCRIIDIKYFIQFEAHLRTCAVNLRVNAPITIGTIPLRSLGIYGDVSSAEPPPPMPSAPLVPSAPTAANTTGPPPPSYATAVGDGFNIKDDDDNEYTMGETTYAPQYTFYDWNQSAFTYD